MVRAVVPVKGLAGAKSRLGGLLGPEERRELCRAMLEDVLRALRATPGLGWVGVVSPDPEALAEARRLGAQALAEPQPVGAPLGLNGALELAAAAFSGISGGALRQESRASGLLVLPADIPLASAADIGALLAALPPPPAVALCPSRGGGTGALLVAPPGAIAFRFGRRSFAAHRREALSRGVACRALRLPALALDVDRPQDLAALLAWPQGDRGESCTARALREMGIAPRLEAALCR